MVQIDIEMPIYCYDCPCHNGENGRCNITGDSTFDKRPFDCPLKEGKSKMDDLISRQVVLKDIGEYMVNAENAISVHPDDIHNYNSGLLTAIQAVTEVPSAQPEGWLEQNKDKILQAGMEGREIDFYIGGRLLTIREKAQ